MNKRTRSKNLSDQSIEVIVQLLDGWASKLTWDHLISAIDFKLHQHYTRQALSSHPQIKLAYDKTKQRLSLEQKKEAKKSEKDILLEQLQNLEKENQRLKKENQELLALNHRVTYNAYVHGLSLEQLNKEVSEEK